MPLSLAPPETATAVSENRLVLAAQNQPVDRLVLAAQNQPVDRPPVWMLRQAGRYLKAYRDLQEKYPSFRDRSEIPGLAVEISLQPYRSFKPDGVIFFSDILTPLAGMGVSFEIIDHKGPILAEPVRSQAQVDALRPLNPEASLPFVGEILRTLCDELQGRVPVLGFVGAPWTLATYLVEGQNSTHYSVIKGMAWQEPALLYQMLARLAHSMATYALYQVQNGAQIIQIFDSWAGHLTPQDYSTFALPYQWQVIRAIKAIYPEVPVTLCVNDSAALLPLMVKSGADVIHVDWAIPMAQARAVLGDRPVQGNLDPCVLLGSRELIRDRTLDVIRQAGSRGHIMNLGQGILPNTPEGNVQYFFDTVRSVHCCS